jgi:hypothetical protein
MRHKINDRITIVTGYDPPPIPTDLVYYAYVDGMEEEYGVEWGRDHTHAKENMIEWLETIEEDDENE